MTRILVALTVIVLALAIVAPTLAERVADSSSSEIASERVHLGGLVGLSREDTSILVGSVLAILSMAALGGPAGTPEG